MNEWFDVARTEKNGKEIWVCLEMGYTFHYRPLMEKNDNHWAIAFRATLFSDQPIY